MVRLESHQRSLDHRVGSKRLRGPVLVSKSNARHGQAPDFRRPVPKHLLVSRSARPAVFLLGFRTISHWREGWLQCGLCPPGRSPPFRLSNTALPVLLAAASSFTPSYERQAPCAVFPPTFSNSTALPCPPLVCSSSFEESAHPSRKSCPRSMKRTSCELVSNRPVHRPLVCRKRSRFRRRRIAWPPP